MLLPCFTLLYKAVNIMYESPVFGKVAVVVCLCML